MRENYEDYLCGIGFPILGIPFPRDTFRNYLIVAGRMIPKVVIGISSCPGQHYP